ncbi:tripartite motif-containing protein 16-like [Thalassophryne amazonica]|uniref:tripartite motif-containing protein 16-like n=1 Tax=Thalassophryne amazonica TaxID=390379 RepID=UPI00147104F4|nr:tripartite motif-containing protein 16-like [Thalassophryne amazonica]
MSDQQQQKADPDPKVSQPGVELDRDQFCCSVCLELLKDPVTISCGHSYCSGCIEGCWDKEEDTGRYSCPQCRDSVSPRPVLRRNHILGQVVEKLKMSTLEAPPSVVEVCADGSDVPCDFCTVVRRGRAVKSCLMCLASYCAAHLEPHYCVPVLQRHQLISATSPLEEKTCSQHHKLMEIYCETDQKCICYLCSIDEHKSHWIISAMTGRTSRQSQLIMTRQGVQHRFQEREVELKELIDMREDFKDSTQTAMVACEQIFAGLILSLQDRCTEVKQLIQTQEKAADARAEQLQRKLVQEIANLRAHDAEMKELLDTEDNIHFLECFPIVSRSRESPDLPVGAFSRSPRGFINVKDCVSPLKGQLDDIVKDLWSTVSLMVSAVDVMLPPIPKTREEFRRYCRPLAFDCNTANTCLSLSQENRLVTYSGYSQFTRPHAFTPFVQVLCTESLSERQYWEVKRQGNNTTCVTVSYKDISRASEFGSNDKSWSLVCSSNGYTFRHNWTETKVSGPSSPTVGVFLDFKACTLSFYAIDSTMTLLHTVQHVFTQPLYPGVAIKNMSHYEHYHSVELVKLWP